MNRKHGQSQSHRNQGMQSAQRSGRQFQNQDMDQDYETSSQYGRNQRGNYSGLNTSYGDDTYEAGRAPSYRDTDYDLDGSTYGRQGSQRMEGSQRLNRSNQDYSADSYDSEMGSSRWDSDRYASDYPSQSGSTSGRSFDRSDRFSSDRLGSDRSFSDRFSSDRYSADRAGRSPERNLDRQGSSSERFGYPSSMNAWSGNDRSYNSGRSAGRMGQGSWGAQGSQSDTWGASQGSYYGSSAGYDYDSQYGENSLDRAGERSHSSFSGKGPKGYKRSDDRIKEEVCETLARNPRIDASDIEVSVDDACVTLSGTVENKQVKRAAEMAIENLSGVDEVRNDIRVKKADDTTYASSSGSSASSLNTKSSKSSTTGTTGTTGSTNSKSHN